jgi:hypothetical protein
MLLIRRNILLVLDLGLDVVNTSEDLISREKMSRNSIIRKCTTNLWLFSSKDKMLLVRSTTLLILDLGLDIVDYVR